MSNYSNFQDPLGLIWRMLRSGNAAARNALFREGFRQLMTPLDMVVSLREKRIIERLGDAPNEHPVILVVGTPRSGTTLVYQVLARCLNVAFPSNASGILWRSPILASQWSERLSKNKRRRFESYYGQTTGLADCNDGFHLWNRWLGEDRYRPASQLTPEQSESMRRFFNAWTRFANRPFLNKSNRNALAIEVLAEHLPNAHFVVVKRNPVHVAQSLLLARQKVQGSKDAAWGLQSTNTHSQSESPVDAVCNQVISVEAQIEQQLRSVAEERVLHTTYETFCEHPATLAERIAQKFAVDMVEEEVKPLEPFAVSATRRVSPEEYAQIEKRFETHNAGCKVR